MRLAAAEKLGSRNLGLPACRGEGGGGGGVEAFQGVRGGIQYTDSIIGEVDGNR